VIDLAPSSSAALAVLAKHSMRMQCLIQDAEVQMMNEETIVPIAMATRVTAR